MACLQLVLRTHLILTLPGHCTIASGTHLLDQVTVIPMRCPMAIPTTRTEVGRLPQPSLQTTTTQTMRLDRPVCPLLTYLLQCSQPSRRELIANGARSLVAMHAEKGRSSVMQQIRRAAQNARHGASNVNSRRKRTVGCPRSSRFRISRSSYLKRSRRLAFGGTGRKQMERDLLKAVLG